MLKHTTMIKDAISIIVRECLCLNPSNKVFINASYECLPFAYSFAEEILLLNAIPYISISFNELNKKAATNLTFDQLVHFFSIDRLFQDIFDTFIYIVTQNENTDISWLNKISFKKRTLFFQLVLGKTFLRSLKEKNKKLFIFIVPPFNTKSIRKAYNLSYSKLRQFGKKISQKLIGTIRVTTEYGTNLVIKDCDKWTVEAGILDTEETEKGNWVANFPSGEVYLYPLKNRISGKIVIQGPIRVFGQPVDKLVLIILDGIITDVTVEGDAQLISRFRKMKGCTVSEFGIGINPHISPKEAFKVTNGISEVNPILFEKAIGFGHIALETKQLHIDLPIGRVTILSKGKTLLNQFTMLSDAKYIYV